MQSFRIIKFVFIVIAFIVVSPGYTKEANTTASNPDNNTSNFSVIIHTQSTGKVGETFLATWEASKKPFLCILFSNPENTDWEGEHPDAKNGVAFDQQSGAAFLTPEKSGTILIGITCFIKNNNQSIMARTEKTIKINP